MSTETFADQVIMSEQERIDSSLQNCREHAVSSLKAISLIAVSGRESSYIWVEPRLTYLSVEAGGGTPVECWRRAPIGLEVQRMWPPIVLADDAAVEFLMALGMMQKDGTTSGDSLIPDSPGVSNWFEWIVEHRKGIHLETVSIGPTQMHLRQSNLNPNSPSNVNGWPPRCGWPHSWDNLWALYVSEDPAASIQRITYLDPGSANSGCNGGMPGSMKYPALDGSEGNCVTWLQFHVGNKDGAIEYYHGPPGMPQIAYKNMLLKVRARASSMGYVK